MRSALVLDGRFRVFEDGSINRIVNGVETPAKTYKAGGRNGKGQYVYVAYCENGKQPHYLLHRLIASAFLPNPDGKREINHIDGNRENNAVSNLRWSTRAETTTRSYRDGTIDPMRNGTPCIFCGELTRSKAECCNKCLPKVNIVTKRIEKAKRQKELYAFANFCKLSYQQEQFVKKAQSGMRNIDIAREMGLSRQRVDQIAKRVMEKQREVERVER